MSKLNIPTEFWIILACAAVAAALFVPIAISDMHKDDAQMACIEQRGNWDDTNQQCTFER